MGLVVTGIAQSANTAAIEAALRAAQLPLDSLTVISGEEGTEGLADSGIRFVYSGTESADNLLARGSMIESIGGVDVPGMSAAQGPAEYFPNQTITDMLSDLEIPDSQLEHYVEAVEAGRGVFVYYANPDTLAKAESVFREAKLANVQIF